MTKDHALTQLLRLGQMSYPELLLCTGWMREELDQALARLTAAGLLMYRNMGFGQRIYMVRVA